MGFVCKICTMVQQMEQMSYREARMSPGIRTPQIQYTLCWTLIVCKKDIGDFQFLYPLNNSVQNSKLNSQCLICCIWFVIEEFCLYSACLFLLLVIAGAAAAAVGGAGDMVLSFLFLSAAALFCLHMSPSCFFVLFVVGDSCC